MSVLVKQSQFKYNDNESYIKKECSIYIEECKETIQVYNTTVKNEKIIYILPFNLANSLGFPPIAREHFPAISSTLKFIGTLRPYQEKITVETFDLLKQYKCFIASLHVGWGKSLYTLYIISKLRLKTLIIVHGCILLDQWYALVQKYMPQTSVQVLKSKSTINSTADIFIINAQNIPKIVGLSSIIGTVVVDELHLVCAKQLFKSLWYLYPHYLIGLSATPMRFDGLDKVIELYFGKNKISEPLKHYHNVYCIRTPFVFESKIARNGKIDWTAMLTDQALHVERNTYIVNIVQQNRERNFLILCKRVEQATWIYNALRDLGESVTNLIGTKRDYDADARILVAITKKAGVGMSFDKLDALILAADIKQYFIQYLGRVFRTPTVVPVIFDLIDKHFLFEKHFKDERLKVYEATGGKIHYI
jgi:superfamily II DNA or RNA helicase